jgi:CubicO group peptidase (beta-lactamase class C family)
MKHHVARVLVIAGCLAAFALPLRAGAGAVGSAGKPEDVGLSSERLGRIREAVKRHIDAGSLPGAVTIVARRGKIAHFEAHGLIDVEAKRPMPRDAVFRLASMSKPITAVAVMMMIEEGKVRLNDPVSRFIPEFAGAKVAMPRPGRAGGAGAPGPPAAGAQPGGRGAPPPVDLVTASRDITVRDLLTHTSGLMSGGPGNAQAPQRSPGDTLQTYIAKLGAVPLDYQPGTMWRYSGLAGFDVLSRIVEVASGQTFDRFLRQRLFDPLGMKDTGFSLPSDTSRLVPLYRRVEKGFERQPNQEGLSSTSYFSGAGGMVSTAEDYLQFAQMLVNGGELNGRRYLGPRTIDLMASNHTGDMVNGQFGRPARGMGFGLGVQVVEDPVAADLRQSKGTFGWAGAYGTNQNMDRHEKMVTIIMMQVSTGALQRDFDNAVMQAIVD